MRCRLHQRLSRRFLAAEPPFRFRSRGGRRKSFTFQLCRPQFEMQRDLVIYALDNVIATTKHQAKRT